MPSRHDDEVLRVTGLALEQWKNFARVQVELRERVFLVGPNAAGTSNLLDALRFLYDLAAPDGGLQEAVARRDGVSAVRCLAARRAPDIGVTVSLGSRRQPNLWAYQVRFSQHAELKVPAITAERVARNGQLLLERPTPEDRRDPQRLTQTHIEQTAANRELRAIAELFRSIRYLDLVPQMVRRPSHPAGRRPDPFGSDLLEAAAETRAPTLQARLRRITGALRIAVPQLSELKLERDSGGVPHLCGRYEHWRNRGAWQTEGQLSHGTLRLFGLLWSILEEGGPLLLEEPELSLHRDVVRRIPRMLARMQRQSGRQIIVSTHSADLLGDEAIALDEVLMLLPDGEATAVRAPRSRGEIVDLVDGALSLGEEHPVAEPAEQLDLFPSPPRESPG